MRTLEIGGGLVPYREYLSHTSYFSLEINPAMSRTSLDLTNRRDVFFALLAEKPPSG